MAQERDTASGYDWEDRSVPTEPEPLALPDHGAGAGDAALHAAPEETGPYGAPSFTYEVQAAPEPAPRRGTLPAWAIVAIVAVQAAAMVASVALVLGGIERLFSEDSATPVAEPTSPPATRSPPPPTQAPEREPGTVTDSSGREVTDGTGGYDRPATIGEHTLSWTAWTDGTVSVSALEVDLDATVPAAAGEDVVQDGYRLVQVTYEVRYEGPGQLAPAEELWLTGESDRTYFPDIAEGLLPAPMRGVGPLQDGEAAQFHSAFLVPEAEVDGFRLGVETFTGEIMYFATS